MTLRPFIVTPPQWSHSIPTSKERASKSDRLRHPTASRPCGGHCRYTLGASDVPCDRTRTTVYAGRIWKQISRLVQSSQSAALLGARTAQSYCSTIGRTRRDGSRNHGHHRPSVTGRSGAVHPRGAESSTCRLRDVEAQTMNTRCPTDLLGGTIRRKQRATSKAKIEHGAP